MFVSNCFAVVLYVMWTEAAEPVVSCRMSGLAGSRFDQWDRFISAASLNVAEMQRSHWSKRDPANPFIFKGNVALPLVGVSSNHLRQDGGLCFEIPPWQHQPVELEEHLVSLRARYKNDTAIRRQMRTQLALANSEISRYMDTVLAPFLDTYHQNIQNSYQQLTGKILRRIKDDINAAIQKKQQIYNEITQLADQLKVPSMCDEERRSTRTVASTHVAQIYACTEEARASIAKMGKYAEEMITITRNHMQATLIDATRVFQVSGQRSGTTPKGNVTSCLKELSRAAVLLGYELDLSLTNARRHNEQSCERLTTCTNKARRHTEEAVVGLKDQLYQCVFA